MLSFPSCSPCEQIWFACALSAAAKWPAARYRVAPDTEPANRRSRSEFVTTVTEESAIAAAAKIGALSRSQGIAGEATASGIRIVLYANAQKRFCRMVRIVARESAIAV